MSGSGDFSSTRITGTVTGYRWWNLWLNGAGPRPPSSSRGESPELNGAWGPWEPGVNTARCLLWHYYSSSSHVTPGLDCGCGFWAFWELPPYWESGRMASGDLLPQYLARNPVIPVTGVIEGWGKMLKGSLGFRCELAKITAMACPPAYRELLAELQPQAMIYTSARAMYAEHPSGIVVKESESERQKLGE